MKSFFTKLGTLLLCGVAVAVVGCTDFSQDIREGDEALKVEIDKLNQSTSATIAELKASISALEAAQKKMENDYAKKTDLDAAKTELQAALNEKVTEFSTAIATINTTLDGKADKTTLSALQKEMEDAIAAAEATIANLDAAQKTLEAELAKKADKAETDKVAADVETLKNGYQETAFALTNLQSALEGTQLDLEATESALKTVAADVESLKQAYMEIVAGFQQFQADLAAKASQADLELAEKDIKALKTASAEATFAIANLSTAVDVIEARVDGIENELNKAKEQIAQQTTQLTNLAYDLEQAKGDLEAEAELREAADKALQTEVAQLVYGLTNLQGAYEVHVQEYEAYKDALKKQIDDLAAQDGALANSIISYYEQAIAAVEESEAALKTLVEEEIAKVTNLIAQERTEIEGMIAYVEKSFAEADEELFTLVQDSLITVVYNTIYNYDSKYEAMFATVDEQIAAMDEEFRFTLNSLAQQDSTLDAMISAVDADLQAKYAEAMMAVVTNRTEIEGMIAYMDEELKGLIAGLTDRVAANEEAIKALQAAKALLEERVEALEAQDGALANSILSYYNEALAAVEDAANTAADNLEAKIAETTQLIVSQRQEIEGMIAYAEETAKADLEAAVADFEAAQASLNEALEALGVKVENLLARVQSLVYVPEYNDHKADINFALVNTGAVTNVTAPSVIVPVNTVLKYRVHTANYDAAKAATELAAAWKAKLANLYFEIKDVRVRAAAEPVLNILDVKANGEYLEFTVLAENFAENFYNGKGSYSSSLVLTDGNNNRSTEYTNLVPNCLDTYNMVLYAGEGEDLAVFYSSDVVGPDNLPAAFQTKEYNNYYIAANDPETVKTLVRPSLGFIPTVNNTNNPTIYPIEALIERGYNMGKVDFQVLCGSLTVTNNADGATFIDAPSQIAFVKGTPNWTAKVSDKCTWEMVGKSKVLTYKYTWAGQTISLGHKVEVSNAQVAVDIVANDTWTVAKQESVYDAQTQTDYAKAYTLTSEAFKSVDRVAHLKPVLNDPAVIKSTKFYVMDVAGEWKEVTDRSFKLAKFNDDKTVEIEMLAGKYSWNNSYKIVWVSTNENDHVDYTTTAIVNLTGRPEKIDVEIPVEFKLNGTNTWFEAPADLCGKAFEKLDSLLGYGKTADNKAVWDALFATYVTDYNTAPYDMPTVNGEKSQWIANLENLATAKLLIGKNKINDKEANVITWSVTPWWGVPVNFTVTGKIVLPKYNFIYSEDYVMDATANVYGQIENGKYSIIKSDLAKYFNVDAESLNGHNYTVSFEVLSPAPTAAENVKVGPQTTTTVEPKGAATYHYLASDNAVLDWADYRGLEVKVKATLFVNGFERETLPLTLVTKDPLTITGADFTVDRELRKNLKVQVFEKLVLTSSVAPDNAKENLLQFQNSNGTVYDLTKAMLYPTGVYGANLKVVLGEKGVYYYNNSGKLIILGSNKYNYDETTGFLEIYGDDAEVKNYYADFTAILDSRICGGPHQVPFRVTATLKN